MTSPTPPSSGHAPRASGLSVEAPIPVTTHGPGASPGSGGPAWRAYVRDIAAVECHTPFPAPAFRDAMWTRRVFYRAEVRRG